MTKKPSQPMSVPAIPKLSEGQLEPLFRRLNLAHTRRIYQEVADRAEKENWTYRDFLALLLAEEVAHRKQTRLQRCTRQAHFPFFKTIDEFDFTLQSTLRQSLLGSYLGPDFVTEGRSLILYGKAGRGKTHLAVARWTTTGVKGLWHWRWTDPSQFVREILRHVFGNSFSSGR